MLPHIQFCRKSEGWSIILRKNFPNLIEMIKKGKVNMINAGTLSLEEASFIAQEGFGLLLDEIVVGMGNFAQTIKILRIERS